MECLLLLFVEKAALEPIESNFNFFVEKVPPAPKTFLIICERFEFQKPRRFFFIFSWKLRAKIQKVDYSTLDDPSKNLKEKNTQKWTGRSLFERFLKEISK